VRWWPFHRRPRRPATSEAAERAKREAAESLRRAEQRRQEIQREMDAFASEVQAAFSRRRQQ